MCIFFACLGAIPLYQRLSTRDPFTAGTGRIWLDNLNCNASERRLIECPRGRPIGNPNNCNHRKDVGVRCEPIGFRGIKDSIACCWQKKKKNRT